MMARYGMIAMAIDYERIQCGGEQSDIYSSENNCVIISSKLSKSVLIC
jgi:hypothetical protein